MHSLITIFVFVVKWILDAGVPLPGLNEIKILMQEFTMGYFSGCRQPNTSGYSVDSGLAIVEYRRNCCKFPFGLPIKNLL